MNLERWPEIKALLGEVLERPPEERIRFLAECSHADAELKLEVSRLMESGSGATKFLEPPSKTDIDPPLRMISLAFTGCSIGDYELLDEIGRGSSGIVYRAKHQSLGRQAAVKILAHHLCASPQARERFRREAEAISKLRHEAVVSIFSFGEQSGAFYIAMELVIGENLRDLIAQSRAFADTGVSDPKVAARLVEGVARGLQHCHENGVIHRDIKPENIVLDDKHQPRLIDFGLAKDGALEGLTETGALAGTPHYMSPEQARALGSAIDARTDIYSLGVVLYELISLKRPFESSGPADLLHAIGHDDPRHVAFSNPSIPPELAAVCMKAIAKRPQDRYATAAAMADDLRAFLSGKRIAAPRYPGLRRVRAVATRPSSAVAGVMLIVLVGMFAQYRGTWKSVDAAPSILLTPEQETMTSEPSVPLTPEQKSTLFRHDFEEMIKDLPEKDQIRERHGLNKYYLQKIKEKEAEELAGK
ncbi:MAG TPA: serine/threonine-protein kinase [Planctomycetota bacterium]|nr:serine/threonine-protein kinase [Planctomycetota bacterium]